MTNVMIDSNVDPRGLFHVIQHTADLHNHRANKENEDNLRSLTSEKGEVGDITLLTDFILMKTSFIRNMIRNILMKDEMRVWVNGICEHQITAAKIAVRYLLMAESWLFKVTFVPQKETD